METASVPALRIEGLQVTYPGRWFGPRKQAVRGIDLTVGSGETVGFLGPNGAGKSTTIKSVLGFVRPDAGSISIFGHAAGSTPARGAIGYLPEVALYYPYLTPMETLRLYGRLQGIAAAALRRQSLELLERVGLAGKENSPLRTLSKGQQQRLGVAQALLGSPRLLVLDEVSSGIDPLGRRELRDLLRDVGSNGTAIFFSSHELDEVAHLCDRVVLVDQGRVVEERPMDAVLRAGIGSALETWFVDRLLSDRRTGKAA